MGTPRKLPDHTGTPAPLGVRLPPETKAALIQAAEDNLRSQASMIEYILVGWLRQHGYLPEPDRQRRR